MILDILRILKYQQFFNFNLFYTSIMKHCLKDKHFLGTNWQALGNIIELIKVYFFYMCIFFSSQL